MAHNEQKNQIIETKSQLKQKIELVYKSIKT